MSGLFLGAFTCGVPVPFTESCVLVANSRGPFAVGGGTALASQRLPADAIGMTTVTFDGVAANCEIRVYATDMTELAGIEDCAANQVLSWPVYAPGSANNIVRVLVMGMPWRVKDFTYTSLAGAQVLPIQQEADKWYSNN